MENLPIIKTAWAANKQMLSMLFSKKGFFSFVLPYLLVQACVNYLDISHTMGQSGLDGETPLAEMLGLTIGFITLLILNTFLSILLTVRWHRRMILDEAVALSPKGLGSTLFSFLGKVILISLFLFAVVGVFSAILAFSLKQLGLTSDGMLYAYIASSAISLIILVYLMVKIVPPLYMVLPATAVGVPLKFSEALKFVKPVSGRLLTTLILSAMMLLLPVGIVMYLAAISLLTADNVLGASLLLGTLSAVSIFPTVGVLSMFFMQYVLPNINDSTTNELDTKINE